MRLQVVVGILIKEGKLLIQQRRSGTACAGQWEFPGGKIESGEAVTAALQRELLEELNIKVLSSQSLIQHRQNYAHANVTLHTDIVESWQGEAEGNEGQVIRWVSYEEALDHDLLAGAYPLLEAANRFMNV